jgi:hypothetical protein
MAMTTNNKYRICPYFALGFAIGVAQAERVSAQVESGED